jgi:FtsP/CotA-like multicopper oxidase with cupredoxin domain
VIFAYACCTFTFYLISLIGIKFIVFEATPAGTHWYHSHSVVKYADGQEGVLIVHAKADDDTIPEWEKNVYEEYIFFLSEFAETATILEYEKLASGYTYNGTYGWPNPIMEADVPWPTILLNGNSTGNEFDVEYDRSYRFRLIHGGANYIMNVSIGTTLMSTTPAASSIDMELVMVDPGTYLEPTIVDFISTAIGSRYDFLVNVSSNNVPPGRYPICKFYSFFFQNRNRKENLLLSFYSYVVWISYFFPSYYMS